MHNAFGVRGADFADLAVLAWIQPSRDCYLGSADGMCDVNVEYGVVAYTSSRSAMDSIFRFRCTRRVPEVRPVRFEDTSTWAYLESV